MLRIREGLSICLLSLILAGCSGFDLPGILPSWRSEEDPIAAAIERAPYPQVADGAERAVPGLDVVEVDLFGADILEIYVLYEEPGQAELDSTEAIRLAVEGIWDAALEYGPPVERVSVFFLRVVTISTFEHGPAQAGELVGGVSVDYTAAAGYLEGEPNSDQRETFWEGEAVQVRPFTQPYDGIPNHPVQLSETE